MISSARKLWLAAVMTLFMLAATSCNDQLRQFIIPIPKPGGDPGNLANSIVLSTNPAASSNGSTMHINVSGDTIAGVVATGPNPVFFDIAASRVFVINGNNTITTYIALLPTTPPFSTVVLPGSTSGAIGGGTSSTGNLFTANEGSGDSNVISANLLASVATVTVGSNPVSIAGNANNAKVYVVNNGSNNVTVVGTADNTVVKTIAVGSAPIWAVMSPNGADVFVVNQGSNNMSVIDTGSDSVIATITLGISPNFAFYEPNRQRVYVSNTGENSVSVIKADGIDPNANPPVLPVLLKTVTGLSGPPVSVAALADGSKAYAALGGCPAGTNHTNLLANLGSCNGSLVSVIDATALIQRTTIPVGAGVVSVATSSDSRRAYAVSAHDTTTITSNVASPQLPGAGTCTTGASTITCTFSTPSVYDINTSTDTTIPRTTDPSVTPPVATFLAPSQDPNCTPPIAVKFNTTVPIPCAGQIPFMVRTFP
ncbi:MAG TPA: YncE family protein [Candidatus Angelobacter sp.]|nr:YncE family protein [Candidatus Angelobacter sp.]